MNVTREKPGNKMKKLLTYMSAIALLCGCAKKILAPAEFVDWVRDERNGLRVEKEIAGQQFILQYKPAEYEMLVQSRNHAPTRNDMDAYVSNSGGMQFYTLTIVTGDQKEIAASGGVDENVFQERVMYMMSDMQFDFELVDGRDTLPCVFFHCERSFNISPGNNIMLGFEKKNGKGLPEDKTLIYTDHLLDCGPVKLTIKADDLENIPELLLSEY